MDQSDEKPDFTREELFSFHLPAFKKGKTGPDTQTT
jgi:hypothetical protein